MSLRRGGPAVLIDCVKHKTRDSTMVRRLVLRQAQDEAVVNVRRRNFVMPTTFRLILSLSKDEVNALR
jgi:hypothetical protein